MASDNDDGPSAAHAVDTDSATQPMPRWKHRDENREEIDSGQHSDAVQMVLALGIFGCGGRSRQ